MDKNLASTKIISSVLQTSVRLFLISSQKKSFIIYVCSFKKCKNNRKKLKIILVPDFCPLKTEISRFSIGFRLKINRAIPNECRKIKTKAITDNTVNQSKLGTRSPDTGARAISQSDSRI